MMDESKIKEMFEVGAHYGYSKSRRHPSMKEFIFGQKGRHDIFNLELTAEKLEEARRALAEYTAVDGSALFLGNKNEARDVVRSVAESKGQPYSCGRYIGGTLTNFKEIRKRVDKLEQLIADKESGKFDKFTKLERLMIDREIEDLEQKFGGLINMKKLPVVIVVVDPEFESMGVKEALQLGIPIIALANSDCDISKINHPIPANDTTRKSIEYFVQKLAEVLK